MRILEEPSDGQFGPTSVGLGECLPQYGQFGPTPVGHSERSRGIYTLVPKDYVFTFLKRWGGDFERLNLSFFEITTGMAFMWFADEGVDIAVIEVGLGGRLDSTNVITPELSIITSIGLDHCDLLGNTLEAIAGEKAGIIKPGVPVVIGEYRPETAPVFRAKASENNAPIFFTAPTASGLSDHLSGQNCEGPWPSGALQTTIRTTADSPDRRQSVISSEAEKSHLSLDLQGEYQEANLRTVLTALSVLASHPSPCHSRPDRESPLSSPELLSAIAHTAERTGFGGRWEHLSEQPLVICDIGHNAHALRHNFGQLESMMASGVYDCLIIVYAVMADKDLDSILPLMPQNARYIFTTPKGKRALPAERILEKYSAWYNSINGGFQTVFQKAMDPYYLRPSGIQSESQDEVEKSPKAIDDVQEAVRQALKEASAYKKPIIYIGGSTFAVAEAKPLFQN